MGIGAQKTLRDSFDNNNAAEITAKDSSPDLHIMCVALVALMVSSRLLECQQWSCLSRL